MTAKNGYIPALGYDALTRFYDPLIRWFLREATFKNALIEQAQIGVRHRVLDVGCGTGTLTLMAKHAAPTAEVIGIDGDPKILAIARAKAGHAAVQFDEGLATALPYPDASFDRILTSLVLHHLTTADKQRALAEMLRVLRPGGELHIADWAKPIGLFARTVFGAVRWLDGPTTRDNAEGRLPAMITAAGFADVETTRVYQTIGGTLGLMKGRKPGGA